MLNLSSIMINLLMKQLSILMEEQGQKKVSHEKINLAIDGLNALVITISNMNEYGLTQINRETIDLVISKSQLESLASNVPE